MEAHVLLVYVREVRVIRKLSLSQANGERGAYVEFVYRYCRTSVARS